MFVLPSSTPLTPGNVRHLVTGTSGGQTSGSGDFAWPDLQTCVTTRGTSVVSRGDGSDRSARAAAPDAHENATAKTTASFPAFCLLCMTPRIRAAALIRSVRKTQLAAASTAPATLKSRERTGPA